MKQVAWTRIAWLVLPLAAVACARADPAPSAVDAGLAADAGALDVGPTDPTALIGAFNVELSAPIPAMNTSPARPGYTSIVGRVSSGPTPSQIIWETTMTSGACMLLVPRVPFCNTPCGGSAACVEDDVCEPYPTGLSVGTVRMIGLRSTTGPIEIAMDPVAFNYQTPAGITLPYPAFDEGAPIHLSSTGGALLPFDIDAVGVLPLALGPETLTIEPNVALPLTWAPPGQSGLSTIFIKLDLSHHGGSKGKIECDVADTGELTIEAPMMTALHQLGIAGFPSIIVTRLAVAEAQTTLGRIELRIASGVEKFVEVPGLVSCLDDVDCTSPQTCQPDLTCR